MRVHVDPRAGFAVYRTTLTNVGAAALQPLTALCPLLLSIGDIRTSPRVMSSAGGGDPGGGYPPRGAYYGKMLMDPARLICRSDAAILTAVDDPDDTVMLYSPIVSTLLLFLW